MLRRKQNKFQVPMSATGMNNVSNATPQPNHETGETLTSNPDPVDKKQLKNDTTPPSKDVVGTWFDDEDGDELLGAIMLENPESESWSDDEDGDAILGAMLMEDDNGTVEQKGVDECEEVNQQEFVGFKTAAGKEVQISKEAMDRARKLMKDEEEASHMEWWKGYKIEANIENQKLKKKMSPVNVSKRSLFDKQYSSRPSKRGKK